MKFRRTIKAAEPVAEVGALDTDVAADPRRSAGKGRPTPKRRDAEPRARGPVPPPPTTRREAYRRNRTQDTDRRSAVRESSRKDAEAALPARDRGPARQLARNVVDARRSVASLFLPFAVIFLAGYFIRNDGFQQYLVLVWTLFFVLVVVDSFALGRKIKARVRAELPTETGSSRSLVFYGVQRSTMVRRWRFPKPAVPAPGRKS